MLIRHPALALAAAAGFVALTGFTPASIALAADDAYTLTIKDHQFQPETIEVPAGKRVKLTVINKDATPEEFESHELHVEKIVSGGNSISVFVGPLKAGSYSFFGEMHEDTAKGTLVAK